MRFLIPEKGVSALDIEGGAFFDPRSRRRAVRRASRRTLRQTDRRRLIRLPLHINDPQFAEARGRRLPRDRRRGEPTMPAIARARNPREIPRHDRGRRSRSSAAAPAPASRPSARRPAASTSSSSTIPAATAWPGAARPPGCSPMATPTRSSRRWRSRCCRWSSTRRCWPASTAPIPFVLMPQFLAELKAMGFSGVQNFPDHRPVRRRDAAELRGDRHGLRARGRHDRRRRTSSTC